MIRFGVYHKGRSVDGLTVDDKGEREGHQVALQIPWLGTWQNGYQLLTRKSRREAGLGKERNQELHFGYIEFKKPFGDLSRDAN